MRQLAKYMKGLGCNVYVIPGIDKQVKYEAHIYTYTELKAFFNAIDKCVPSPFSPTRRYVIPVVFRMFIAADCVLPRRCLQKEDVDLRDGKIIIRQSKGWKARIVY